MSRRVLGSQAAPFPLAQQFAWAWCNWDGDAAPAALRDAFNVTSLTDNAAGDFTVTFDHGFRDGLSYVVAVVNQSAGTGAVRRAAVNVTGGLAAGSARVFMANGTTGVDHDQNCLLAVGGA